MDPVSPEPGIETAYFDTRELADFHRKFRNDRPADTVMHGWGLGEGEFRSQIAKHGKRVLRLQADPGIQTVENHQHKTDPGRCKEEWC